MTGTPVRRDIGDLRGFLIFLRFEPFCDTNVWKRLVNQYQDVFIEIFRSITIRHTKKAVKGELQIPSQRRVVIRVPFTAVEEHHYHELFDEMCKDCDLDEHGSPMTAEWDPENPQTVESMRSWVSAIHLTIAV